MFGVSRHTMSRYVKRGIIKPVKLSPSKYMYDEEEIFRILGQMLPENAQVGLYARTAPGSPSSEMINQVSMLTAFAAAKGMTIAKTYTDKCTSLEFSRAKRTGIFELLLDVAKRRIGAVIVESPDRIALLGNEIVEAMLNAYKVRIIYVNRQPSNAKHRDELMIELTSVVKALMIELGGKPSGEVGSGSI